MHSIVSSDMSINFQGVQTQGHVQYLSDSHAGFSGHLLGVKSGSSHWSREPYMFLLKFAVPLGPFSPTFIRCYLPNINIKSCYYLKWLWVFRFWWWTAWIDPYLGKQQEFSNEIVSMSQAMQSLVKTKFYLISQKINGVGGVISSWPGYIKGPE